MGSGFPGQRRPVQLAAAIALAALAGCAAPERPVPPYPGGKVFLLTTKEGARLYYGCAAEGPGGRSAEARAAAAHRYFTQKTDRFADLLSTRLMDGLDAEEDEEALSRRLAAETEIFAQKTIAEMQRRHACVLVDNR